MYADTHSHTLMKYVHNNRSNLWRSFFGPLKILGFLNNIIGIPAFSQADLRRLCKGKFQVVFFPLHPPEQKIMFTNLEGKTLEDPFEKIASQVISIPVKKIEDYKSEEYNHFAQLAKEHTLLLDNEGRCRKLRIDGSRKKCYYKVVRDFSEIEKIIDKNAKDQSQYTLVIVLTIEGLHALGRGHIWHNNKQNTFDVNDETFLNRVDMLKGISSPSAEGWKASPLVINVTHAFDNGLFGHSKAISGLFEKIFDYAEPHNSKPNPGYSDGLNQPMTVFGEQVIKRLLNIDETSINRSNPGKRIIPDIKHMSTKVRKRYYEIIEEHNANQPNDIIPVIMSHAAVNGKPSLLADQEPSDEEDDYACSNGFNPWSINLYDDEIIKIHRTNGLIGIIFDERILAGKLKLKRVRKSKSFFLAKVKRKEWLSLIIDQIEHIIKTIQSTLKEGEKKEAWNCICIGSDFDGQINPINAYKKATDFDNFKNDLIKAIAQPRFEKLRAGWSAIKIADKICFENVHGFLSRNFK